MAGRFTAAATDGASSREIAVHEAGHAFSGLGDEYDSAYPGFPDTEEPNTTRETNPASIKWRDWILGGTPIPTPETSTYAQWSACSRGRTIMTPAGTAPNSTAK